MNYGALFFILVVSATLGYLAFRLVFTIYTDYSNAAQVRNQLLQRLKLLQLHPLFQTWGVNNREVLCRFPLHAVERLIRQCENCSQKQLCAQNLSKGDREFALCPLRREVRPLSADLFDH